MYGAQTEFGKLKRVLMHRPGRELEQVTVETEKAYNFRRAVAIATFQGEYDALVESISPRWSVTMNVRSWLIVRDGAPTLISIGM